jgi:hypothetical protein
MGGGIAHLEQLYGVAGTRKQRGPALDLGLARTLHHHIDIVGKLFGKLDDALQHRPVLGAHSGGCAHGSGPAAWHRHVALQGLVHEQLESMAEVGQLAVRLRQLGRLARAAGDGRETEG